MVRSLAQFALWLVAVLFAAVMTFAPASAHPGHQMKAHMPPPSIGTSRRRLGSRLKKAPFKSIGSVSAGNHNSNNVAIA